MSRDYHKKKIEEVQRDIDDWTKTLEILDSAPDVKAGMLEQYNMLAKKIEDWKRIKAGLLQILAQFDR
jgi:hypothetical protein